MSSLKEDWVQGYADKVNEVIEGIVGEERKSDLVAWLIATTVVRRALVAVATKLEKRIEGLDAKVQVHLAEMGVESVKHELGATVYPKDQLYITTENGSRDLAIALHDAGLTDFLGYNAQSLKAYVKEMRESGTPLPETITREIKITVAKKLVVRAS